ncbi:MAG: MFS transporter [Chitinophagaceae bacterium]|nr:MFS transporter [Chitinophagaceae bacterium]
MPEIGSFGFFFVFASSSKAPVFKRQLKKPSRFFCRDAIPEDRDRVSAKGFAFGYVGSVLLQLICFVFVFNPGLLGGDEQSTIQFRTSFLLVGIWWWGFGQFSLRRLPKPVPAGSGEQNHILSKGYKELQKVWAQVKQLPKLKRFLLAFFFYNMGVQTVMLVATLYGKSELEIPTDNLIIAILLIQLIAIPGAFVISWLSSKIGNLKTLMTLVVLWIILCIAAFYLPRGGIYEFYAMGAAVGFIMGDPIAEPFHPCQTDTGDKRYCFVF